MRINNRFSGIYAYGRPLLEDSKEYKSIKELKVDYMKAIEDFHTLNLHTFPTVELDKREFWALVVYFDTLEEVMQALSEPTAELLWVDGTTVYFMVDSEEEENKILTQILGEE